MTPRGVTLMSREVSERTRRQTRDRTAVQEEQSRHMEVVVHDT